MSATVTVAIPFAKEPLDLVRRALESLIRQDHTAWTGIVVDDSLGGSSELEALVESYEDARLRYLRHDGPHGIGAAWNACMDAAQTELFCILHTDDELHPEYLTRMLRLVDANPGAALYFCGVTIIDGDGKPCFSLPDAIKEVIAPQSEPIVLAGYNGVARLTVGDFILAPTILYSASRIASRRFSTAHKMVLDLRFLIDVLLDGGTIAGTHRRLYRYRRHAGQQTSQLSATGERFEEELAVFRELEAIGAEREWPFVQFLARARPIYRLNAIFELLRDLARRRTQAAAGKLRYVFR